MKTTISKKGIIKMTSQNKKDSHALLKFMEAAAGIPHSEKLSLQREKEFQKCAAGCDWPDCTKKECVAKTETVEA
jgi:hypothetical protein